MTYGPRIMPRFGNWSARYDTPDRMVISSPGLDPHLASQAAYEAVRIAQHAAPKLHGAMSGRLRPVFGPGFYGIWFEDQYAWFQDRGIKPFTMRRLAGKTIPMWINDPDGKMRKENPKAKIRTTVDGRTQVLIFRRAAKIGARKFATKRIGGQDKVVDVPASYPGAPGRITKRVPAFPDTPKGLIGGQIAKTNVGVRWRHPGLNQRGFIEQGLLGAASKYNIEGDMLAVSGDRVV